MKHLSRLRQNLAAIPILLRFLALPPMVGEEQWARRSFYPTLGWPTRRRSRDLPDERRRILGILKTRLPRRRLNFRAEALQVRRGREKCARQKPIFQAVAIARKVFVIVIQI